MNDTSALANHRRSRRFGQRIDVDVIDRHGTRRGRAINVARHGLFVAVVDPPRDRHLVQLVLHLPDGPLQAAASVSRIIAGQGVGLSLFALSTDAKRRWDAFIIRTQQRAEAAHTDSSSTATTPSSSSTGPVHGPDMPSFLIKLKTLERLQDYLKSHVAAGGTVLFTPVLPTAGTLLQLVIVHPATEVEFALLGRVFRAVATPPKRLEILFEPTDLVAFGHFVDSGQTPRPAAAEALTVPALDGGPTSTWSTPTTPHGADRPTVEQELDFEISDDNESMQDDPIEWDLHTSDLPVIMGRSASTPPTWANTPPAVANDDDDRRSVSSARASQDVNSTTRGDGGSGNEAAHATSNEELLIDDTVPAADPGFRPTPLLLRCETRSCPSDAYAIELGPCSGVMGLVADQVPYWSSTTNRVISVPRLAPSEVRRDRFNQYVKRGGHIDDVLSLSTFLAAADLAEDPRHPMSGEQLRSTRAIERLAAAARRVVDTDAPAATRIRCPHCATGHIVVQRA